MIRNQNIIDRLYLSQGDEDTIYIDNCKVPQHNIEGIRFLYKQFKRRKCGVILNDPVAFGRNIQICLFLKAVFPLLHRPILILCQEGNEQHWVDRIDTWTGDVLDGEVAIETANPFIKKMLIINAMVNLHLFCAREWSIVVVDGDEVTSPNPILKLPFKASFKIWNTSVNMRTHLDRFEEVYKWLYPREIFLKCEFIGNPESAVDLIEKSILLDSFFEDLVLRRDELHSSYDSYRSDHGMAPPMRTLTTITVLGPNPTSTTISVYDPKPTSTATSASDTISATLAPTTVIPRMIGSTTVTPKFVGSTTLTPRMIGSTTLTPRMIGSTTIAPTTVVPATSPLPMLTITKKNKDATGTKIKRSKPRVETETVNKPAELSPPTSVLSELIAETSVSKEDGTFDKTVDFSIENYKKKTSKDNGAQQSSMESNKDEVIEVGKKDEQIEVIEIDNLSNQSESKLFYEPDSPAQSSVEKLLELDTLVFGHDTLICKVLEDSNGKESRTPSDKKATEPHTILTCKPVCDQSTQKRLFTDNKKSTSTVTSKKICEALKSSDNTERDKKNDSKKILPSLSKISSDKREVDIIKMNLDELNREMRELDTREYTEKLAKRQKTTDSNSQTAKGHNEISNELNGNTSVSGTKVTEQVANSLKRNNIDDKMKECEENVSKKFKGSFLDSLF